MKGIKPKMTTGESVVILGVRAVVTEIVPETDWSYRVTLSSLNGGGGAEVWDIIVPSDYNTLDGHFAWE